MEVIFKDVDEGWLQILNDTELKPILDSCLERVIDCGGLCPAQENILEAFRYPLSELKIVLIGQDPYPDPRNAHGLCFSAPQEQRVPASLRHIFNALVQSKIITEKPAHPFLGGWADQGVLMINAALTTLAGKPKSHEFWHGFTRRFIRVLTATHYKLIFLLWGNDAKKMVKPNVASDHGHILLEWGHPSPMSPVNNTDDPKAFKYCNHFTEVNRILAEQNYRAIIWDPDYDSYYRNIVFTDGCCRGNGKKGARAGWAYYMPKTFMEAETNVECFDRGRVVGKQTNNAAELLGIINALRKILALKVHRTATFVITDSEYCCKMINCWMWRTGWVESRTANKELIEELRDLLLEFRRTELDKYPIGLFQPGRQTDEIKHMTKVDWNWPGITCMWVQASHDRTRPDDDIDAELWDGNYQADALANQGAEM